MNAKQSLMAAIVGIAAIIAMPLAASAGGYHGDNYANTQWQARGAVMPVGHHYGWRNSANNNSGLVCDADGDDCHPAVQCDADGDDCQPSSGYEGQYYGQRAPAYNNYRYNPPSYNNRGYDQGYGSGYGAPAYNDHDYNQGYGGGAYNAPYDNNGAYAGTYGGASGGLSTLAPLLQQFVR